MTDDGKDWGVLDLRTAKWQKIPKALLLYVGMGPPPFHIYLPEVGKSLITHENWLSERQAEGWKLMESAPCDETPVALLVPGYETMAGFIVPRVTYHADAGYTIGELHEAVLWQYS